ncbi:TetR/AcrR family transcriptional regulator [Microbacterium luticocti]|uniref:TetR/AcrR family transcriptional regulator n=1 Tax=Microbacterium luticocti TaxID=451764 RepID=UPI0004205E3F|nr:TetR/AcrR family transcriptional regulator [Microbacterium luticocti]
MVKGTTIADDITRAAVGLFAENGYAGTSVQQIVEAAGVTKGALYHYFGSKDDLLFGIYDRLLGTQQGHLDAIVSAGGDIDDVLTAVCMDVVQTTVAQLDEAVVFFQSAHMLSAVRREEVTRRRRRYHDAFGALITRGQKEGRYRTDIPLPVLIAHFFADVHYLGQWYSPTGTSSADTLAHQLTALFLAGIRRGDAAAAGTAG